MLSCDLTAQSFKDPVDRLKIEEIDKPFDFELLPPISSDEINELDEEVIKINDLGLKILSFKADESLSNPPFTKEIQHNLYNIMGHYDSDLKIEQIGPFKTHENYWIILPFSHKWKWFRPIKENNKIFFKTLSQKDKVPIACPASYFLKSFSNQSQIPHVIIEKFAPNPGNLLKNPVNETYKIQIAEHLKDRTRFPDDVLIQIAKGMAKGTTLRRKIQDEPNSEEAQNYLKFYDYFDFLPDNLTVLQGQSSYIELVYFVQCEMNVPFRLGSVNSTSIDAIAPFGFIDDSFPKPIIVRYRIVSKVKALPILYIYLELKRRGIYLSNYLVEEAEIQLYPSLYLIRKIYPESHFRIRDKTKRVFLYEVDVFNE